MSDNVKLTAGVVLLLLGGASAVAAFGCVINLLVHAQLPPWAWFFVWGATSAASLLVAYRLLRDT